MLTIQYIRIFKKQILCDQQNQVTWGEVNEFGRM